MSLRLCLLRGQRWAECGSSSSGAGRSIVVVFALEDIRGEEALKAPDGGDIPRGIAEPHGGALPPHSASAVVALSVRCDLSFLICLYFLSCCVVIFLFFFF